MRGCRGKEKETWDLMRAAKIHWQTFTETVDRKRSQQKTKEKENKKQL